MLFQEGIIFIKSMSDVWCCGTLAKIHKFRNQEMEAEQTLLLSLPVTHLQNLCLPFLIVLGSAGFRGPGSLRKNASTSGFSKGPTELAAMTPPRSLGDLVELLVPEVQQTKIGFIRWGHN